MNIFQNKINKNESRCREENLPPTITGPIIVCVFFGFQVFEKMPPKFPSSFSPCKQDAAQHCQLVLKKGDVPEKSNDNVRTQEHFFDKQHLYPTQIIVNISSYVVGPGNLLALLMQGD